ncbi:hypothetical protein [Tessaracoccus sp.]|uniref:hypothetical protein n=1 Tax=Tessaracoccus sp. TaxID=1971211 RepID=UPI00261BC84B|nr:hypothetical protein [Tessaracoccus sp.]
MLRFGGLEVLAYVVEVEDVPLRCCFGVFGDADAVGGVLVQPSPVGGAGEEITE